MPFRFSFPLPGRKASDVANSSPILIDTPNDSHDNSPLSDPGSKAERVLGCFDSTQSHAVTHKPSRKALRKKPSFTYITLSGAENESAAAKDGFPFPEMPGSTESSRRPSYNVKNQPSSPLLGEHFHKGSPGTESISNSPSPRPHFYGRSSTLRSYYDPAKSPLSISQQTSASSARDMALRKGHRSIASPLSQDMSNGVSPNIEDDGRSGPDHAPSRKTAQLDCSDGLPRAQLSPLPIISPDEVAKSPSRLSHSSSQHSASSARPNWWKRKSAKEPKSKRGKPTPEDARLDQFDLGLDSLKTNIRKPKAATPHWFDGVDEDRNHDGQRGQPDADEVHRSFWNKGLDRLRPERDDQPEGMPQQRGSNEAAFDEKAVSNDATVTGPGTLHDARCSLLQDAPQQMNPPKTRSQSSTDAKADLSNQSFLELSSSSDEETEDPGICDYDYQHNRVRDRMDQNTISDNVPVGSAERVRPAKTKPVAGTFPRRSKRGSEMIPPVPKIPERPQLQPRVSSIKWREIPSLKAPIVTTRAIHGSMSSSGGASITSQTSSFRQASMESQLKRSTQGSKIMTVTVEEGELLEAMRQTRASIRQDAFSEGYTRVFHSTRNHHPRPRTSGADGRGSYPRSDRSITPPPSLAPADVSPVSFRFPDVPSLADSGGNNHDQNVPVPSPTKGTPKPPRQAPPIIFPPPEASPTDSFSPSDILPSTPGSRLSPRTPSFMTQEDDLHNTFGGLGDQSPGGGNKGAIGLGKAGEGHLRQRTSSSVVMLDGMEERARVWESEEEWLEGRGERW
ncbi:MAG: hypothetical protein Q9208_008416 [Pyrenodesmia sp. 3 TL-2023]